MLVDCFSKLSIECSCTLVLPVLESQCTSTTADFVVNFHRWSFNQPKIIGRDGAANTRQPCLATV